MRPGHALVLFSGGQDSTTCLAWALTQFAHVETIGFDYGQRHHVELQARQAVLSSLRAQFPHWCGRLGDDGLHTLVGGMCETDFSGYPDCRDDTLKALQVAVSLGMGQRFTFETPLMWIDKADTWELAHTLGGQPLVELIIADSHTCYHGVRDTLHPWGYGCGACPACELRQRGYERWTHHREST